MSTLPLRWARRGFEAVAHQLLSFLILAGLLLMVAVVVVPIAHDEAPSHEAPLLIAVPLVLVLQLMSGGVHRFVDWILYGYRGDVSSAAWRVAHELESAQASDPLPSLLSAMAATLRLSFVEVRLGPADGEVVAASCGRPTDYATEFELRHAGERMGVLLAARRGQALRLQDQRLLHALAAQVAVVTHANKLAADLQRTREKLVAAREDERRRLRRDLHDGVGPALAGIALGLESADRALHRDPGIAHELMSELRTELTHVIVDVRGAVDGLRPPLLDEVGLVVAIEQVARSFGGRLGVTVDIVAGDLPHLPAAVEVGVYRIAVEALTNVVRHSGASGCTVTIDEDAGKLVVRVDDDGHGMASASAGHGISSMRERAEELGGSLTIDSGATGTAVAARIPIRDRVSAH